MAGQDSTPRPAPSPLVYVGPATSSQGFIGAPQTRFLLVTHEEKSPSPGFLSTQAGGGRGLPGTLPLPQTTGSWGPRPGAPPHPEPKSLPAPTLRTLLGSWGQASVAAEEMPGGFQGLCIRGAQICLLPGMIRSLAAGHVLLPAPAIRPSASECSCEDRYSAAGAASYKSGAVPHGQVFFLRFYLFL